MKEQGEIAGNPLSKAPTYPGNRKRLFIALFGIAAGLTVIWYTAMFTGLSFLKSAMRVEDTLAEIVVGVGAAVGMLFYLLAGHISDRSAARKPIVIGYLTLLLLFPAFWLMGASNPALAEQARRAPVTVAGRIALQRVFDRTATQCGKLLADLAGSGVPYSSKPRRR
jgi:MFS family permease